MPAQHAGDLNARHYKENSQLQFSLVQDLLKGYPFSGNERVLDIGCGDGKITAQIAEKLPNGIVIGIDKSPSMIALANACFPKNQYSNLTFEVKDAAQLDFADLFDLITSFSCLHWVKDQAAVLKQIGRLLKPDGQAIILTYTRGPTFWDPIEAVADSSKWHHYFVHNPRPYQFLNEADYNKIVPQTGLKIVHIETSALVAKFEGQKGFEDYVKGWLPFLIDLPTEHHEEFLHQIGEHSLKVAPVQSDGYVYHPYEKVVLVVRPLAGVDKPKT